MNGKMEGPDLYIGEGQTPDIGPKVKAIGELIRDARNLSADDLDRIGRYQRENELRFGEAAIALGLGTALVLEQMDKRMRTTSDAFDFLGLPVIGIMPSPNMNRRLKGQMALIQDRVVSGRRLPAPDKGQA